MKRRTFLLLPALTLTGLALPNSNLFGRMAVTNRETLTRKNQIEPILKQLKPLISFPLELAKIGDQYLRVVPEYKNVELLLSNMGVDAGSFENTVLFENQRAKDFEAGSTVSVDGWVLSKAEISLCCAVYLSSHKV